MPVANGLLPPGMSGNALDRQVNLNEALRVRGFSRHQLLLQLFDWLPHGNVLF
jgi:hypothetical protein